MKSTDIDFYLFDGVDRKRNKLFYFLKDRIVGGPSIIFSRYHEANKLESEMEIKFVYI